MQNDRIESNTVEEAETVGELVDLIEDCATNLDDCKFRGVGGVRGGGKDTEIALDFALCADRVE